MLAGLQDNGTVRRESDETWTQVALGDGGDCATNLADPDVRFHSDDYMAMGRSQTRGDRDSWDDGVSPPDDENLLKLFYPPLEVNGEVVVKAGEVVYLSTDSASSWSQVALPQPASGRASVASALAIPAGDHVLVGTIRGEVFRIDHAGGGWGDPTALTSPLDGWISDLVVDGQRYWVTNSSPGAVLRSDDQGATWTDVTANLPAIPVNAILTDPADSDRVWVACDVGVFESGDAGGSWTVLGTGLPNALAEDLVFDARPAAARRHAQPRGLGARRHPSRQLAVGVRSHARRARSNASQSIGGGSLGPLPPPPPPPPPSSPPPSSRAPRTSHAATHDASMPATMSSEPARSPPLATTAAPPA